MYVIVKRRDIAMKLQYEELPAICCKYLHGQISLIVIEQIMITAI
jgi:hypothetical protein